MVKKNIKKKSKQMKKPETRTSVNPFSKDYKENLIKYPQPTDEQVYLEQQEQLKDFKLSSVKISRTEKDGSAFEVETTNIKFSQLRGLIDVARSKKGIFGIL